MHYFQDLIQKLTEYWAQKGCASHFGYDLEVGAGTFNPTTFFRSIGPEPYKAAYLEPSRRPTDGRYGDNPNRMQHFLQFQVILKPSPKDIQALYLESLKVLGIDTDKHDIRFVHDDWKSPTLGAWGLGWEVWIDGMEVSQFTYFQHFGGIDLDVIPGEITYGFERLAMYLQNIDNVYDLKWNKDLTYGDIFHQNEVEWSTYNFEESDPALWQTSFDSFEKEALNLLEKNLPIPAYDFVMKASHAFNMLEARGVISVSERTNYINRVRNLSCRVAKLFLTHREKLEYPLLSKEKKAVKTLDFKPSSFDPTKTDDFILEIGVEEMPQSYISEAIANLKKELSDFLLKENISFSSVSTYGSPRRLVAFIENLAYGSCQEVIEKKGPSVEKAFDSHGNPSSIGRGFLDSIEKKAYTLKDIYENKDSDLFIKTVKGQPYLFVTYEKKSVSAAEIFHLRLPKLFLNLDFPKKMRWGTSSISFVRPIHWIVALHGKKQVPIQLGDIHSSNTTFGHPALHPEKIVIKDASDYFSELEKGHVIVNQDKRKDLILEQITKIEKKEGAKASHVSHVMKEVLYLTESPTLITGSFDPKFLELPKELLELVLMTHQRHFPLIHPDGHPLSKFIICLDTKSNPTIKKGHEKAVSPRLADGLFLFHQDLKQGLKFLEKKLEDITFHQDLGSLKDKSDRLLKHARLLYREMDFKMSDQTLEETSKLLKADLASNVVFEFPELQGVMGREYAKAQKYSDEIADAIFEHWLPRFDEDQLPKSFLGILFSLADKIDNLLACFLTNRIPTSSSDPFALRRQTLGIIRILIENKISLPLKDLFVKCAQNFALKVDLAQIEKLVSFFESRVKTVLTQYKLKPDEIQAILTLDHLDIYDLFLRAQSLHAFKDHELFKPLFEVYKRASGQLNVEVIKEPCATLFDSTEEKELYEYFKEIEPSFYDCLNQKLYPESFHLLATLQKPLANLFDHVKILVQDEKIRMNRLSLLSQIVTLFKKLLNFDLVTPPL